MRTLIKFGDDWRKISHKSKCKKDFESTLNSSSTEIPHKAAIFQTRSRLSTSIFPFRDSFSRNPEFLYKFVLRVS